MPLLSDPLFRGATAKRVSVGGAILLLAVSMLAACGRTISPYSPRAYEQATSLKVESLALMDEATEPFAEHAESARQLRMKLEKAHEFAKGRPQNEITARQWEILIDPAGNLLGGFLTRWEEQGTLSSTFVGEAKKIVRDAFNTIIELESGKMRPDEVQQGS